MCPIQYSSKLLLSRFILISEAEYCVLWQYSKQLTIFILKTYFKSVKLSTVSYHSTVLCPMAVPEATVLCPMAVPEATVLYPTTVPEANCTVSYGST